MGIARTKKYEEGLQAVLPNNPFVPPNDDVCYINNLPPELLSRIFEIGSVDDSTVDEDDVAAELWDHLGSDIEMKEESEEESERSDEEESDEDGDFDTTGSSIFLPSQPPFPTLVSHVCRHWRNVALSTPSLWTMIMVTPEARPPYEPVSTLLERSKGLPIDIYVDCEPNEDDCDVEAPSEDDLRILFSMFIPHIHRWHTMEVSVSEYQHMYVFLSAVSDSSIPAASQLTTLELYHHEDTEESDSFEYSSMSKHLTLFGGSAPLLTRLVLWGVHVDWNQPWIASASNLRDLEFAYHSEDVLPSWSQFATLLRGASVLEKLSLRLSGPAGEPPEWFIEPTLGGPTDLNAPVQLPHVTDFILAFHSQARAIGLIRKFYLPAIKNLVLDFDHGDYTDFVRELTGPATTLFATQEQPHSLLSKLKSLKIAGLPCSPDCVDALYGELQNLMSLNISLSYLPLRFLDILCTPCRLSGRGDIWLPRLVTLYVSGTSGDTLREVVRKRKEAGAPLNSLYVEESSGLDDEDVDWLKKNVKTFEFFEGSDDEDDIIDFEDLTEEVDEWSDVD